MDSEPPNDQIAEQAALGSMLLSASAVSEVTKALSAEDFYLPAHATIFQSIIHLFSGGTAIDPVAVGAELEKRGKLKNIGGAAYLLTLIQNVPTATNAAYYAKLVADKSKLRKLQVIGSRLQRLAGTGGEDIDDILAQAEVLIRKQKEPSATELVTFDDLVEGWRNWQDTAGSSIPTPWAELNSWLNGGLNRGRLYTIGGRPAVGKSLGGLNIAAHAAERGFSAAFFSLEMGRNEVASRVLAAGGSADLGQIIRKELDLDNLQRVDEYAETYRGMPLAVVDKETVTVEQIIAQCRAMPKLDVCVVDYLQLVRASDSRMPREQQVAHISRSLKIASRELDVAMVVAAQLNRGPVRDGVARRPTIADLRESGAVEQDSDVVLLLHRGEDEPGLVEMICGKNRSGKTGNAVLSFHGSYARIGG